MVSSALSIFRRLRLDNIALVALTATLCALLAYIHDMNTKRDHQEQIESLNDTRQVLQNDIDLLLEFMPRVDTFTTDGDLDNDGMLDKLEATVLLSNLAEEHGEAYKLSIGLNVDKIPWPITRTKLENLELQWPEYALPHGIVALNDHLFLTFDLDDIDDLFFIDPKKAVTDEFFVTFVDSACASSGEYNPCQVDLSLQQEPKSVVVDWHGYSTPMLGLRGEYGELRPVRGLRVEE